MSITIHWWYLVIVFFLLPFLYTFFRKSEGNFDVMLDVMLIFVASWIAALGIMLGHYLRF